METFSPPSHAACGLAGLNCTGPVNKVQNCCLHLDGLISVWAYRVTRDSMQTQIQPARCTQRSPCRQRNTASLPLARGAVSPDFSAAPGLCTHSSAPAVSPCSIRCCSVSAALAGPGSPAWAQQPQVSLGWEQAPSSRVRIPEKGPSLCSALLLRGIYFWTDYKQQGQLLSHLKIAPEEGLTFP